MGSLLTPTPINVSKNALLMHNLDKIPQRHAKLPAQQAMPLQLIKCVWRHAQMQLLEQ